MSSLSSADRAAMPPPASLTIHLDLVGGLAGDMFVAAMIDALPALAGPVLAELAKLQPAGSAMPTFHQGTSGGLRAQRFGPEPAPGDGAFATPRAAHVHGTAAPLDHSATAYPELRRRIADAPLAAGTREHALALLALLGDAEARVHGTAIDDVHFHELADWDSLQDVVAAGCIAACLAGARWTASAPPLGRGTVRTSHGVLPVPAPATMLLLEGYPWRDDGVAGERVTPTGAAILRHLVAASDCDARRDGGRLVAIGCGAGTRELPGVPNLVRALAFERAPVVDVEADTVAILEFDIDDMTGEEIALAADRLRAISGVVDVSVGTRAGKKGRPLADFRVLAQPPAADAVAQACFTETSTLGLRIREERRRRLPRSEATASAGGATLPVKIATRPGGGRTAKAAHDAVASAPSLDERRRVRATGERHALEGGDE
ncbi:MAG: LarC family nickel insertion protein [Betaproteobacteria bacterium]